MKMVFEVFSAFASTVAVKDTKDLYVRPVLHLRMLVGRMDNVQYDSNPVLVVLSDQAHISVGREGFDCSESFIGYLAILEVWQTMVCI
jgi:hypothetical protein